MAVPSLLIEVISQEQRQPSQAVSSNWNLFVVSSEGLEKRRVFERKCQRKVSAS